MGPGPSNCAPSVLAAMARPLVGHLDPEFVQLMEETKAMLRAVLRTENAMTFPVSGTGSAGMEFCFVNLVEPGDEVIIGVNGVFGARMVEVAERCGARVTKVTSDWGRIIEPAQIAEALARTPRPKLVAVVHAETSTGARSPIDAIAPLVRDTGALLLVDAVTSVGGCTVETDAWGIDALYSGTQKCLSCPPGLAPVTLSERALAVATRRARKVQSWYLDVNLLAGYWGQDRVYHHTAPITMNYALHEALRLVLGEGLEARFVRHEVNHRALKSALDVMGLKIVSQTGHQLWQLNAVEVPAGIDEALVRKRLLAEYGIEIGAGLGPMKGRIWRVGLMGETSTRANVARFLGAFSTILAELGHRHDAAAARAAVDA